MTVADSSKGPLVLARGQWITKDDLGMSYIYNTVNRHGDWLRTGELGSPSARLQQTSMFAAGQMLHSCAVNFILF
jgi:hypothetical protein